MSTGKGKQVANKPDWKQQLAMLDQEMGWDDDSGSEWAESGPSDKQQVNNTPNPPLSDHDNNGLANLPQSTQNDETFHHETENNFDYAANYNAAQLLDSKDTCYDASEYLLDDDPTLSPEMQQSIWEAAVMESNRPVENHHQLEHNAREPCEATSSGATHDEEGHTHYYYPEQHTSQCVELNNETSAYFYYHYGHDTGYESRCWCHVWLYNATEERNKATRAFYSSNGTVLQQENCVLLPYPQEALPGTEKVDKPMLVVTTPEGETLFPHDLQEYPEPAAAKDRPVTGGLAARGGYVVPYEEEDSPDF